MSNQEHYFENLLYHGVDNINDKMLSKEEKEAIEICVNYVLFDIFHGREDFLEFVNR